MSGNVRLILQRIEGYKHAAYQLSMPVLIVGTEL